MASGESAAGSLERFRALIRVPTVSRTAVDETDWEPFDRFIALLPELYPAMHGRLERELLAGHSLLYRWTGTEAGNASVLMAHYDVVAATDDRWEHPPFGAELTGSGDDQLLWGRGTLDDKGALASILEAVEAAALAGFTPNHDIYLAFGHDEETYGSGAQAIVALLQARGIRADLVLDEGGAVVEGIFPGVTAPTAVVGVSEKGIASVDLSVRQNGGHASTPPRLSATVRLSRAITRLANHPFRSSLTPVNLEMIQVVGAHAAQPYRWVFGNVRLTRGILRRVFGRLSDETNAMVRSTAVVTRMTAGLADNALAESASATVNLRIAIDSSVSEAVEHIRRSIDDPEVSIAVRAPHEPSPVSPRSGAPWELLARTVGEVYPGTVVTPYVMLGASDSRHFTAISESVYRFTPFRMSADERGTLHAVNERIHVATWLAGIRFYGSVIAGL